MAVLKCRRIPSGVGARYSWATCQVGGYQHNTAETRAHWSHRRPDTGRCPCAPSRSGCGCASHTHRPTRSAEGQFIDLMASLTEDPLASGVFAVGQLIVRMELKQRAAGMTGPAFDPEVMQDGTCPWPGTCVVWNVESACDGRTHTHQSRACAAHRNPADNSKRVIKVATGSMS